MEEINNAMNYFWDKLEGAKGIRAHRPTNDSNCTMGAWYAPHGLYHPEELEGLSIQRFCEALQAEGIIGFRPGCNTALAEHRLFYATDVYGSGTATNFSGKSKNLSISDKIQEHTFHIPWFKKFRPKEIDQYAEKVKLVIDNYQSLLTGDDKNQKISGNWGLSPKNTKLSVN